MWAQLRCMHRDFVWRDRGVYAYSEYMHVLVTDMHVTESVCKQLKVNWSFIGSVRELMIE